MKTGETRKPDDRVWGTAIGGFLNEYSVAYMKLHDSTAESPRVRKALRDLVREIRRRLREAAQGGDDAREGSGGE